MATVKQKRAPQALPQDDRPTYFCGWCAGHGERNCDWCLGGCPECYGIGRVVCPECKGDARNVIPPSWI